MACDGCGEVARALWAHADGRRVCGAACAAAATTGRGALATAAYVVKTKTVRRGAARVEVGELARYVYGKEEKQVRACLKLAPAALLNVEAAAARIAAEGRAFSADVAAEMKIVRHVAALKVVNNNQFFGRTAPVDLSRGFVIGQGFAEHGKYAVDARLSEENAVSAAQLDLVGKKEVVQRNLWRDHGTAYKVLRGFGKHVEDKAAEKLHGLDTTIEWSGGRTLGEKAREEGALVRVPTQRTANAPLNAFLLPAAETSADEVCRVLEYWANPPGPPDMEILEEHAAPASSGSGSGSGSGFPAKSTVGFGNSSGSSYGVDAPQRPTRWSRHAAPPRPRPVGRSDDGGPPPAQPPPSRPPAVKPRDASPIAAYLDQYAQRGIRTTRGTNLFQGYPEWPAIATALLAARAAAGSGAVKFSARTEVGLQNLHAARATLTELQDWQDASTIPPKLRTRLHDVRYALATLVNGDPQSRADADAAFGRLVAAVEEAVLASGDVDTTKVAPPEQVRFATAAHQHVRDRIERDIVAPARAKPGGIVAAARLREYADVWLWAMDVAARGRITRDLVTAPLATSLTLGSTLYHMEATAAAQPHERQRPTLEGAPRLSGAGGFQDSQEAPPGGAAAAPIDLMEALALDAAALHHDGEPMLLPVAVCAVLASAPREADFSPSTLEGRGRLRKVQLLLGRFAAWEERAKETAAVATFHMGPEQVAALPIVERLRGHIASVAWNAPPIDDTPPAVETYEWRKEVSAARDARRATLLATRDAVVANATALLVKLDTSVAPFTVGGRKPTRAQVSHVLDLVEATHTLAQQRFDSGRPYALHAYADVWLWGVTMASPASDERVDALQPLLDGTTQENLNRLTYNVVQQIGPWASVGPGVSTVVTELERRLSGLASPATRGKRAAGKVDMPPPKVPRYGP